VLSAVLTRRQTVTKFCTVALILTLFLSGCGFQLRGYDTVGQVHFQTVLLQNEAGVRPEVKLAIRKQLELSGVQIVASESEAEVLIRLRPTGYRVSRTAYSGLGDATAELLSMSQPFTAVWVLTGNDVVSGSVETYRDRQIETDALLAAEQELIGMQQSMAENLARQMMDRINRAVQKQFTLPKTKTATP